MAPARADGRAGYATLGSAREIENRLRLLVGDGVFQHARARTTPARHRAAPRRRRTGHHLVAEDGHERSVVLLLLLILLIVVAAGLGLFRRAGSGHCPAITTPRRDSGAAVRLVASLSPSVSRPRHGLTDSSADGRLRWWNDHRSGRSRVPAAPSAAPCRPPDTDAEYPAHPATARSETSAMTPRGRRRGAAPSPASSASRALVPAIIPRLRPHRASPAASSAPASTSRGSSGTLSSRRPRPDTAEAIAENMSTDAARSYSPRAPLSERSRKRMRVLSYCSAGQRLNNENLDSDSFAYVSRVKPRQLVNYHHFECTYENCVIIQLGDF